MLYIQKQSPSHQTTAELRRIRSDALLQKANLKDGQTARSFFDQVDKSMLRKQLLSEQRGLCAYCMRRIYDDHHTAIEHFIPVQENGELALDYANMFACCDGGRRGDAPRVLCCDAAKGNHCLMLSPYDNNQMSLVRYDRNGRVYIWPEDKALQRDIDEILHLNGNVDKSGKTIQDTATNLVYCRRQIYRVYEELVKSAVKRNKNLHTVLQKKKEQIQNSEIYPEFAGVWLYFLNRKLKDMK